MIFHTKKMFETFVVFLEEDYRVSRLHKKFNRLLFWYAPTFRSFQVFLSLEDEARKFIEIHNYSVN